MQVAESRKRGFSTNPYVQLHLTVIFFVSHLFPHLNSSKCLAKLKKLTDQAKGQKFIHKAVVSEPVHLPLPPPVPLLALLPVKVKII